MNADVIKVRFTQVDDQMVIDCIALALLYGAEITEVDALPMVNGSICIPREWSKRARRRARQAAAHTGSNDLESVLCYWAAEDYKSDITFEYR